MRLFNLLPQQRLLFENPKPQHLLLSTAIPLTRTMSTLAAKTIFSIHYSVFKFKSVTKYFAQDIIVTELTVIYDFAIYERTKYAKIMTDDQIRLFENIRCLQHTFHCKYYEKHFAYRIKCP